jgi:hypothetical protein
VVRLYILRLRISYFNVSKIVPPFNELAHLKDLNLHIDRSEVEVLCDDHVDDFPGVKFQRLEKAAGSGPSIGGAEFGTESRHLKIRSTSGVHCAVGIGNKS